MSDLLSPLLYVMENEVDAFWCFASYMDQMVRIRIPSFNQTDPENLSCIILLYYITLTFIFGQL
jgi:hypothetical protein